MRGNRKQREKELDKTKTKPPHSIGTPGSSKVLNVSKKSQVIQKKSEKSALQSKLISVKNENGTKSLVVSKINEPASARKALETRSVKSVSTVPKPAVKVESKVSVKSPNNHIYLKKYCYLNGNLSVYKTYNFRSMNQRKKKQCHN